MKKLLSLAMTGLVLLGTMQQTCMGYLGEKRIKKSLAYIGGATITTVSAFLLGNQLKKSWYTPKPDNLIISAAGTCALALGSLWGIPKIVECFAEKVHLNTSKDRHFNPKQQRHNKSTSLHTLTPEQQKFISEWPEDEAAADKSKKIKVDLSVSDPQEKITENSLPNTLAIPRASYSPLNKNGEPEKSKVQINAEKAKKISFWLNFAGGIVGTSAGFYAATLKLPRI